MSDSKGSRPAIRGSMTTADGFRGGLLHDAVDAVVTGAAGQAGKAVVDIAVARVRGAGSRQPTAGSRPGDQGQGPQSQGPQD